MSCWHLHLLLLLCLTTDTVIQIHGFTVANTLNIAPQQNGAVQQQQQKRALPAAPRARPMPIPLPKSKNPAVLLALAQLQQRNPIVPPIAVALPRPKTIVPSSTSTTENSIPTTNAVTVSIPMTVPSSTTSTTSSTGTTHHETTVAGTTRHPAVPTPNSRLLTPTLCLLPSDFWCDHPAVAKLCTGSTAFCEAYKTNRAGRGMELKLAFETGCPDSQKFIVHRLYPKVLSNPSLAGMVDFKAVPWGLAKRQFDHQVRCHHGPRECAGNRLISCALKQQYSDPGHRDRMLNCFMGHMMGGGEPETGMVRCASSMANVNEILNCARSEHATRLQAEDESETAHILTYPRFVPFVSLNGWNHLELQAPAQLLLAEKLAHWNSTLNKVSVTKRSTLKAFPPSTANCEVPPDFWCSSDPEITHSCYNTQKCQAFHRSLYGRPVHLKVIFNSALFPSREYLHRYLRPHFFSGSSAPRHAELAGKVQVELQPAPLTRRALAECRRATASELHAECRRRILEICIASTMASVEERNNQLICINSIRWFSTAPTDDILSQWQHGCYPAPAYTERIRNCVNDESVWRLANARLGMALYNGLWPERRRSDPWIVLNGHSLASVQQYARVLDQMICLWYRGPGHDRTACGRCEYEPTHC